MHPVIATDALAWAGGHIDDDTIRLRVVERPQAVFVSDLTDWRHYRQSLRQIARQRVLGAVCMVFRTANDTIDEHFHRLGAVPTLREVVTDQAKRHVHYRFIFYGQEFDRFFQRFQSHRTRGSY